MLSTRETQPSSATTPEEMHAIVQSEYGESHVLRYDTIATPTIAADQVLIEVHAAGVDRGVWHLMTGLPFVVRIAGYGLRSPKHPVPGMDVAGVVVAVGDEVTRFETGDRVFGICSGAYAEYVAADADKLASIPPATTFEQAAVAAISGITALEALTDVGRVEAGDSVLIVGASGGVGTFAIQLAKALGASVTGVGGPRSLDMMRSLGADQVIDYTTEDFVDGDDQYDVIIDIGGRNSLTRLRRVLSRHGTLVIVGGEDGNKLTGGVGRQAWAMVLSPFTHQRLTAFISSETHTNIERLAEFMEAETVTPRIGRQFDLADTAAAIRHLETSDSMGKSVIIIRD